MMHERCAQAAGEGLKLSSGMHACLALPPLGQCMLSKTACTPHLALARGPEGRLLLPVPVEVGLAAVLAPGQRDVVPRVVGPAPTCARPVTNTSYMAA